MMVIMIFNSQLHAANGTVVCISDTFADQDNPEETIAGIMSSFTLLDNIAKVKSESVQCSCM